MKTRKVNKNTTFKLLKDLTLLYEYQNSLLSEINKTITKPISFLDLFRINKKK